MTGGGLLRAARQRKRSKPAPVAAPSTWNGQIKLPGLWPIPTLSDPRAVARRRALTIHAYVGPNGHFKSATMILDTIPSLLAGRPVLSTVELLDPATGKPHPLYIPFVHWDQVRDFRFGDLLLDEVVGIANSRSSGMPDDVQNILNQLRRRDVLMRWTAPDYSRADKIIRETSLGISVCHGYQPDLKAKRHDSDSPSMVRAWAPNRLASVITYDAKDMSRFVTPTEEQKARKGALRPKIRQWYWAPATGVFNWYNTMSAVSQVSYLCPVCRGRVVAKTCKGGHSDDDYADALSSWSAEGDLAADGSHVHDSAESGESSSVRFR